MSSPPQLTVGMPVNLSADVPIVPPFAMLMCVIFSALLIFVTGLQYPFVSFLPLYARVAIFAIAVASAFLVLNKAGGELKAAGSGTLFTPVGGLATSGIYKHTRNPMYAALVFMALPCFAIVLNTLWPVAFMPVLFSYLHFRVIAVEEALLSKAFGASFEAYKEDVPRWILCF